MAVLLKLQTHFDGRWHDAAQIEFHEPERGHQGAATFEYEMDYFVKRAAVDFADGRPVLDRRAVSSCLPVDLAARRTDRWPAFLLDFLPQGLGRAMACDALGLPPLAASSELPLLQAAAGSPVGNVRLAGSPVGGFEWGGVSLSDILDGRAEAMEALRRIPRIAPAAIALQGEWPKVAMVEGQGGLLYPEGGLPDEEVCASYIIKFPRSLRGDDAAILELEALYADAAAIAGLDVHAPARHGRNCLAVTRFDRSASGVRHGQESLVSASGICAFGHLASHEEYLHTIVSRSDQPGSDASEYLARDFLNFAFGNPDNHGRNTALSRSTSGGTRLSPLFDFAPMSVGGGAIRRATNWACMRDSGRIHDPEWRDVVRTVSLVAGVEEGTIRERLRQVAEAVPTLAEKVRKESVWPAAASHATRSAEAVARKAIRSLSNS